MTGTVLVDAHVHFYRCFRPDRFFDAARNNFRRAALTRGVGSGSLGCILLAERSSEHYFDRFASTAGRTGGERWSFRPTGEAESILACHDGAPAFVVVAGRQIATQDGLEVLALATTARFPDGRPIRASLDAALAAGAIGAVPWGFGKWWFRRGALVAGLLHSHGGPEFFLGDNGGRPRPGRPPRLFAVAQTRGVRVLPGTDPLPLSREENRVGGYGLVLQGNVDLDKPARSIRALLHAHPGQPPTYGWRVGFGTFLRNQIGIRVRKRATGRAQGSTESPHCGKTHQSPGFQAGSSADSTRNAQGGQSPGFQAGRSGAPTSGGDAGGHIDARCPADEPTPARSNGLT